VPSAAIEMFMPPQPPSRDGANAAASAVGGEGSFDALLANAGAIVAAAQTAAVLPAGPAAANAMLTLATPLQDAAATTTAEISLPFLAGALSVDGVLAGTAQVAGNAEGDAETAALEADAEKSSAESIAAAAMPASILPPTKTEPALTIEAAGAAPPPNPAQGNPNQITEAGGGAAAHLQAPTRAAASPNAAAAGATETGATAAANVSAAVGGGAQHEKPSAAFSAMRKAAHDVAQAEHSNPNPASLSAAVAESGEADAFAAATAAPHVPASFENNSFAKSGPASGQSAPLAAEIAVASEGSGAPTLKTDPQPASPPSIATSPLTFASALDRSIILSSPPPDANAVPLAGVAVEIAARASEGNKRFEIRLDPPELGRIDVRLDVARDGSVSSRLVVERAETLDMLRRDAGNLERALQSAGLNTSGSGLEFSLRDGSGHQRAAPENFVRADLLIVPDDDVAVSEAVRRAYSALRGLGAGVDIQV
jgi:flagellar hook-length control protein FliK